MGAFGAEKGRFAAQDSVHGAPMGGLRPQKGPLRGPEELPRDVNGGGLRPLIYPLTDDTIQYSLIRFIILMMDLCQVGAFISFILYIKKIYKIKNIK